jgi:hypothetical protein
MSAAKVWALFDAMEVHPGGCVICGDDDEFSPDIEAFEETGVLMCSGCFEAQCEDDADETLALERMP